MYETFICIGSTSIRIMKCVTTFVDTIY